MPSSIGPSRPRSLRCGQPRADPRGCSRDEVRTRHRWSPCGYRSGRRRAGPGACPPASAALRCRSDPGRWSEHVIYTSYRGARLNGRNVGLVQDEANRLARRSLESACPGEVRDVAGLSSWGVFLSYRREDAAPYARLLQVQLSKLFPDARVFMDLDSIEAGLDFAEVIRKAVDSCAVLVAWIGRQWATLADEQGHPRLYNPNDFMRFEIQRALQRGVRVIPVLVDGARPLRQEQLPAELHELAPAASPRVEPDPARVRRQPGPQPHPTGAMPRRRAPSTLAPPDVPRDGNSS